MLLQENPKTTLSQSTNNFLAAIIAQTNKPRLSASSSIIYSPHKPKLGKTSEQ